MKARKKVIVSISLNQELPREIDQGRGLIPRSAFTANELKQGSEFLQSKEKILDLCTELEGVVKIEGRYPVKNLLMSPVAQMMVRDIRRRVKDIKVILEPREFPSVAPCMHEMRKRPENAA